MRGRAEDELIKDPASECGKILATLRTLPGHTTSAGFGRRVSIYSDERAQSAECIRDVKAVHAQIMRLQPGNEPFAAYDLVHFRYHKRCLPPKEIDGKCAAWAVRMHEELAQQRKNMRAHDPHWRATCRSVREAELPLHEPAGASRRGDAKAGTANARPSLPTDAEFQAMPADLLAVYAFLNLTALLRAGRASIPQGVQETLAQLRRAVRDNQTLPGEPGRLDDYTRHFTGAERRPLPALTESRTWNLPPAVWSASAEAFIIPPTPQQLREMPAPTQAVWALAMLHPPRDPDSRPATPGVRAQLDAMIGELERDATDEPQRRTAQALRTYLEAGYPRAQTAPPAKRKRDGGDDVPRSPDTRDGTSPGKRGRMESAADAASQSRDPGPPSSPEVELDLD